MNLRGIISQLSGSRRGAAGRTAPTARGTAGTGTGGRRGQDEAIGRGVRKLLRRGR